ncbi:hypothetical protein KQX54_003523 [Cotesia glomerata]|uniref:Uncharacterized protein n=1 Tax=Cotesia glomerata TaxID=32391 RepID=A0AAV7HUZ4_COTGL|nr:hypothetical protein KQX54_003523 [Cotesia glomerata]
MNHFLKMSSASIKVKVKARKIQKESDAFPTTCRPDVKDEVVPRTEPVLWAQGDRLLDPKRAYPSERSQRALAWMHNAPAIVIPSSKLAWGCELPMQEMPVRTSSPLDMSDVREILNVHAEVLTFESSKRSEIESNGVEVKETTSVDSCEPEFPDQVEIGQVIISKKRNLHIFTVIVKLKIEDRTQLNDVLTGITKLKEAMDYFDVKTVRIARTGMD